MSQAICECGLPCDDPAYAEVFEGAAWRRACRRHFDEYWEAGVLVRKMQPLTAAPTPTESWDCPGCVAYEAWAGERAAAPTEEEDQTGRSVGCSCGADTIPGSIHSPTCDDDEAEEEDQ